nr:hypothetical protein [Gemella sp. zg-570]
MLSTTLFTWFCFSAKASIATILLVPVALAAFIASVSAAALMLASASLAAASTFALASAFCLSLKPGLLSMSWWALAFSASISLIASALAFSSLTFSKPFSFGCLIASVSAAPLMLSSASLAAASTFALASAFCLSLKPGLLSMSW